MQTLSKCWHSLITDVRWRTSLCLVGVLVVLGAFASFPRISAHAASVSHTSVQPMASQPAFANLNDYPWQGLTFNNGADGWGMAYGQCVSYVAWKVYEMNGGYQRPPSIPAAGWMPSDAIRALVKNGWPDAGGWADAARNAGIPIDSQPFPGDIAEWNFNGNGGTFSVGHVALVYAVNGDGSIDLAQYNLREDSRFSTLHMPPGGAWDTSNGHSRFWVGWPDNFIHLGYMHMPGYSQFGKDRYQLHSDGSIWLYTGPPITGWQELDNNPKTTAIATDGNGNLYQLHYDGSIYKYTGPPISGWQQLDNNPMSIAIAVDGQNHLYQLHTDGTIWLYTGSPRWLMLDKNPKAIAIATDGSGRLYQLHNDGSIWLYNGPPITGWQELDNNPKTVAIAADGAGDLYQIHTDGSIYKYTGPPISGWLNIDNNPKSIGLSGAY